MLGPTFETKRLIVRPPQLGDLHQWVMADADDVITRNSGTPKDRLIHYADLLELSGTWALNGFGSILLFRKEDNVLIGRVGPSLPLDWPEIEVGWALLPEYEGKGYA